jgi:hypothetical protein
MRIFIMIASLLALFGCSRSDGQAALTQRPVSTSVAVESSRGYNGARWLAAAISLTKEERDELADLTPGVDILNGNSTWNTTSLRWEQDFQYEPDRTGKAGPRAILPMSEARAAFREREFSGMKWAKLPELRKVPGFVELPPNASVGKPYGGEDAVWDIYYKPRAGGLDDVVRGAVGGVEDGGDDFSSRSLTSVPSKGFKTNGGGSGSGYTVYVVPHDMSEQWTKKDPVFREYIQYQEERVADLAQRGPPPHASLRHPAEGMMRKEGESLQQFNGTEWDTIGRWDLQVKARPDNPFSPKDCVIQWPDRSAVGSLYCTKDGYWRVVGLWFGTAAISTDQSKNDPPISGMDHDAIYERLRKVSAWTAQYIGCPITQDEPWPRAVYDENTVTGIAANEAEQSAYYNWNKKRASVSL